MSLSGPPGQNDGRHPRPGNCRAHQIQGMGINAEAKAGRDSSAEHPRMRNAPESTLKGPLLAISLPRPQRQQTHFLQDQRVLQDRDTLRLAGGQLPHCCLPGHYNLLLVTSLEPSDQAPCHLGHRTVARLAHRSLVAMRATHGLGKGRVQLFRRVAPAVADVMAHNSQPSLPPRRTVALPTLSRSAISFTV